MSDFHEPQQPWQTNGSRDMGLGMALGRLQSTLDHQTPILVNINKNLEDLPGAIASQLKTYSTTSVPGAPTIFDPSKWAELLKAALPVIIVLGAIFKRINLPDWQGLIKSLTH